MDNNSPFGASLSDLSLHSPGIKVLPLGGVMPSIAPSAKPTAAPVAAPAEDTTVAVETSAVAPVAETPVASLLSEVSAALDGQAPLSSAVPAATDLQVAQSSQVAPNKTKIVVQALRVMEENIKNMIRLLEEDAPIGDVSAAAFELESAGRDVSFSAARPVTDGRIVEGVFDGNGMVGSDGNAYSVPPNYASKSKLVEGDMLKLTITPKGTFIFKQIGPIGRERVVGSLGFDNTIGEYYVTEGERKWNVLKASVTYFKGDPCDEAIVLIPVNTPSKWAAVENIVKKNPLV